MSAAPETNELGEIIIKLGIVSLMITTVIGLGSLLYYVFELSSQPSALHNLKAGRWSAQVKANLQRLYTYLFLGTYNSIIFSFVVYNDKNLFTAFCSRAMVIVNFVIQLLVKNGDAFATLNSQGIISLQRFTWFWYTIFEGGLAAPTFLQGLEVVKVSVHLTCIIVSLLVIMALTAPYKKFYNWKDALNYFELLVLFTSLGTVFLPVSTFIGAVCFAISFYGGLIYFAAAFLSHAQAAHLAAAGEDDDDGSHNNTSNLRQPPFCALCKSIPMLLDVVSIFSRIMVLIPPD